MKVKRFEDLEIWKNARELVKRIYSLTTSKESLKHDYGFKDQLQRASISIMNNIAEGFERDNNKEFIRFLTFSKGSSGEVRSLLYLALDLNYIDKKEFDDLYEKSIVIIKQISSFIKYLKNLAT